MKKEHRNKGKKQGIFLTVLYMIVLLLLLSCIGFFYYMSHQQTRAYQEEKKRLQAEELYDAEDETSETELKSLGEVLASESEFESEAD